MFICNYSKVILYLSHYYFENFLYLCHDKTLHENKVSNVVKISLKIKTIFFAYKNYFLPWSVNSYVYKMK